MVRQPEPLHQPNPQIQSHGPNMGRHVVAVKQTDPWIKHVLVVVRNKALQNLGLLLVHSVSCGHWGTKTQTNDGHRRSCSARTFRTWRTAHTPLLSFTSGCSARASPLTRGGYKARRLRPPSCPQIKPAPPNPPRLPRSHSSLPGSKRRVREKKGWGASRRRRRRWSGGPPGTPPVTSPPTPTPSGTDVPPCEPPVCWLTSSSRSSSSLHALFMILFVLSPTN
jgi:hypothetical protein